MSIMFRNSNATLEKELAAEDYKAHPARNRLAVLAVALSAILLSVTFSVGIGYVQTYTRALGASPGPGCDSASILGDEEILKNKTEGHGKEQIDYDKRNIYVLIKMCLIAQWFHRFSQFLSQIYPKPRTFFSMVGEEGLSSIFSRSRLMLTESVFSSTKLPSMSHMASSNWLRDRMCRGFSIKKASREYSLAVSVTGCSLLQTRFSSGYNVISPETIQLGFSFGKRFMRAFTLETSTFKEKGFVI